MNIVVFHDNRDFEKEIGYTFEVFFSILGIDFELRHLGEEVSPISSEREAISILYCYHDTVPGYKYVIQIWPSDFFGKGFLTRESLPKTPLNRTHEGVPIIYSHENRGAEVWIRKSDNCIETNMDIIASSFFMLSRYEEVVKNEKDQFERFPASAGIAYQEGFLDIPIVNEYIEIMWRWIDSFNLGFKRRELWEGKDFAVCITHDVDIVKKKTAFWTKSEMLSLGSLIKHGQFIKAKNKGKQFILSLFKEDPYWTFDYILDTETSNPEDSSSFYFRVGGSTEKDYKSFKVNDQRIKKLIRRIESKGCEVGLHPSFDTFNDIELIRKERMELDEIVQSKSYGSRQHFLRWQTPETWRILEKVGIKYDTSLGFPEYSGFRCGICFPYQPFDIIKKHKLSIWELPLVFMDATLFKYRDVTSHEGFEIIQGLINNVRKHHGVFTLLWHNNFLDEVELPGWRKVYEQTVEFVNSYSAFRKSGIEIIEWWQKQINS